MYNPYNLPSNYNNSANQPITHNQSNPFYEQYTYERVLPPAEPQSLMSSAEHTKQLLEDAVIINETFRTSPAFALQLTTAAKNSDHQTVHYLINNLIKNRALVSFSPGGISINLIPLNESNNCCYIIMFLNWKEAF
ncbi:hypothetical protein [Bacillus massiliigorillae]|uniref:hypothetical protein n=1 Tax=Bacillus massiliigorillae TaxID=1243664 RepID=UPI0005A80D85|nr:hypothetical protein [Bacillus massiliigorillae]